MAKSPLRYGITLCVHIRYPRRGRVFVGSGSARLYRYPLLEELIDQMASVSFPIYGAAQLPLAR